MIEKGNIYMNAKSLANLGIFLFFSYPVWTYSGALWFDNKDNRLIAELELMNDYELHNEAQKLCIAVAAAIDSFGEKYPDEVLRKQVDASNYLETITLVARKKNKGQRPQWASDISTAIIRHQGSGDALAKKCLAIQTQYFKTHPNWYKQ